MLFEKSRAIVLNMPRFLQPFVGRPIFRPGSSAVLSRQGGGVLKPSGYHNWSEFLAGGEWEIADPQKKRFTPQNNEYVAMRIYGEKIESPYSAFDRFRVSNSALSVKMDF